MGARSLTAGMVFAGVVSWASPALAAEAADSLRGLNAEYDKALVNSDVQALDRIYSEDFTYTTFDGVLRSRAEQIAFVKAGKLGLTAGSSDEVRIRVYGDFAVITGQFNGALGAGPGKVAFQERYTTAWLRRDGRWVLLVEQGNSSSNAGGPSPLATSQAIVLVRRARLSAGDEVDEGAIARDAAFAAYLACYAGKVTFFLGRG
jgi:ketosteroid isomerase-like protein